MKREILEKYIGKCVEVTLFDGNKLTGVLYRTDDERYKNDPSLYLRKNFYTLEHVNSIACNSYIFRCSHVTKLKSVL